MKLNWCNDIRCFSDNHYTCPKCYSLFHIETNYTCSITVCKNVTCFDSSHHYCPDCHCIIHINIIL